MLIYLAVASLFITVVNSQRCLYSQCACTDDAVNCRSRSFTSVPQPSPLANRLYYKQLSLSNNLIKNLRDDSFVGLNLTRLWLRHNNLTTVSKNAFRGIIGVNFISFQSNDIELIEDSVFEPLTETLEMLNLNDNLLKKIPNLSGMKVLNSLNLTNNRLNNLNSDISMKTLFPNSLNVLALNNNNLSYIERKWFSNLVKLEYLYLGDNNIETIEEDAFDDLESLKAIDLSNNSLTRIAKEWFFKLTSIDYIFLSTQRGDIKYIEANSFDLNIKRDKPISVFLNGNGFKTLENRSFCPRNNPRNATFWLNLDNSTFSNVNPCVFRQLDATNSLTEFKILNEQFSLDFDCSLYNYFLPKNLSITLEQPEKQALGREYCGRQTVAKRDVCAGFTQLNCFDSDLFVTLPQTNGVKSAETRSSTGKALRYNEGDSISIPCTITGVNNEVVPEIEWQFKNEKISDDTPVKLNPTILTKNLAIKSVKRNQTGKYHCVRSDGTAAIEVDIIIQSRPSQPEIKEATSFNQKSTIKWKVKDYGDQTPTDFHLEWYTDESDLENRHTYSAKLQGNIEEINVPFQIPSNATLKIYVENKLGKSDKSSGFLITTKQFVPPDQRCIMELQTLLNKCFKQPKQVTEGSGGGNIVEFIPAEIIPIENSEY